MGLAILAGSEVNRARQAIYQSARFHQFRIQVFNYARVVFCRGDLLIRVMGLAKVFKDASASTDRGRASVALRRVHRVKDGQFLQVIGQRAVALLGVINGSFLVLLRRGQGRAFTILITARRHGALFM